jgi:PAS domain S-box-containing protein
MKLMLRRTDGKTIPVEISLDLFQGFREDNKTYAVIRDLTQRMQMENELQKTNEFLKKVIHSSVDGIIAADMKGNIIIFNEGAERLLGYRAEEVLGRIHITKLYPPDMAKEIMRRLRGGKHGYQGKLPTTPTTLIAKNGEQIPVNISAAIVYEGEEGIATVGIFTDLRERIQMQQQLDNTYRQLFQSEKLSSLGTLAAGVAHEINNPLNNISTSCQILIEELKELIPAEHLERFKWIEDHVDKAKDIVRALLEFSREQEFEYRPVDFHDVVGDTLMLIKGEIPSHMELRVELPEQFVLNLDKTRMEQALMNLVINGIHSMREEGVLTIRGVLPPDSNEAILEVEDTGIGISRDNLPLIFDPFFTTKDMGEGTGLGLSLTYDIIKRHGGTISVTSEVDVGTKFTIRLPLPEPS